MKHAAKPSQLKLAFFFVTLFKFTFIQPFLQFAFIIEPFIRFLVFEPVIIFALAELPFLHEPRQQTSCGLIFL